MTSKKQTLVAFIIGFIMLLIVMVIVIAVTDLTKAAIFVVSIFTALAAGSFASVIPGALNIQNTAVKAGGPIAVTVLVFYFAYNYFDSPPPIVHDYIIGTLTINGKVASGVGIDITNCSRETTETTGYFKVDASQVDKEVDKELTFVFHFPIDLELGILDYDTTFSTESVLNKSTPIKLTFHPPAKALEGKVWDIREHPIKGVVVSVGRDSTVTDSGGYFSLKINSQEERVAVTFEKEGYQPITQKYNIPYKSVSIAMNKIQR
ncbi:MAG: hypothetical protein ACHQFW_09755 [Chitinophagales bacterium]